MKKTLLLPVCIVMTAITVKAQVDPPPPPPPPKVEVTKFKSPPPPPVITVTGKKADEFYQRNPTVADISRKGDVITLTMKDKTTQAYDMSKNEEKKTFTDAYGESPIPGPPRPPKKVHVKVKMPPPPPPPPKPVN